MSHGQGNDSGAEIDFATAVVRRQTNEDVVVRGDDLGANRALAQAIEAAAGPYMRGPPHKHSAGPLASPHFQQVTPPPDGHTFYETDRRKARKRIMSRALLKRPPIDSIAPSFQVFSGGTG